MKVTNDFYRRWYTKGWAYSHRGTATLDHGDSMGYPDAWYDGYMDYAVGRDKWEGPDGPREMTRRTCSGDGSR